MKVGSVERHNRLYKPSLRMRYSGYIHEEIFANGRSLYQESGRSGLVFDHYSSLKPLIDAELKAGLYALMLLRAYNQPDVRGGTNPWWFETYVPQHLAVTTARAHAFAERNGCSPLFYNVRSAADATSEGLRDIMATLVPHPLTPDSQEEVTFDLANLRTLHSVSVSQWTGKAERAFWGEWNHPGEGSRSLTSIVEAAQSWHWDRFLKPGKVAIDIGGHSGDTAIPMALFAFNKASGRKGDVVVVEPNPAVMPVLDINLALNTHLGRFHSLMAAVTAEDLAEIELADHGDSQRNGGVLRNENISSAVSEKLLNAAGVTYRTPGISLATLFQHIREHVSTDPVGFIKIDCEGYDKEIIRPCRYLFAEHKPVLFIEWFSWYTPEDDADLFKVIEDIGYVAYEPATLKRAEPGRRCSNLLCLHRENIDDLQ